jgi:hypothetical protein
MNKKNGEKASMNVVLRAAEQAKCTAANDATKCSWTYTDTLPTVTSMTATYDAAAEIYKIKVAGSGFTGAKEAVSMEIDTWP